MLNNEDRSAIEGLFTRLSDVERKAPPRDAEAEALIAREIVRQPGSPYYMAQTILVQEHALSVAERRIAELEAEVERGSRGNDIFGGLFGGGNRNVGRQSQRYQDNEQQQQGGPWNRQGRDDRGGGGFLAGAAQTALGVTGGILIGNAIGSMFGAGSAQAAEAPAEQPADQGSDNGADAGADAGGDGGFDTGGGFDGGSDFDFGGDF
jgi:hypothetical protein